jgi:CRP/FNR family cyclic AMP-dependent transcriptional regulator
MLLEMTTRIPLFQDLKPEQTTLLEPLFDAFTCPPETVIFEQGEEPQYLYLLLKGTVAIRYKPYDGPLITITHLRAGDVFGWSAVLGGRQYTSSLVSVSEIEAVRVRGVDLWNLTLEYPETGRIVLDKIAGVVSSRWKNARTEVKALLDQGVERAKRNGGKR